MSASPDTARWQYAALAVALIGCAMAALLPSPMGRNAGSLALLIGALIQVPAARADFRAGAPIALFAGTGLAAIYPAGGAVTTGIVAMSLLIYLLIDMVGRLRERAAKN